MNIRRRRRGRWRSVERRFQWTSHLAPIVDALYYYCIRYKMLWVYGPGQEPEHIKRRVRESIR